MNKYNIFKNTIYLICVIIFFIIGILYEIGIIERKKEYEKESLYIYGFFVIISIFIGCILLNTLQQYFEIKKESDIKKYTWICSHILAYGLITFVSPGQWPFWIALGFLWEWFEFYIINILKINNDMVLYGGAYDIMANITGVAIAMWIHDNYKLESLYKKNSIV
jgi:hypothetical protein